MPPLGRLVEPPVVVLVSTSHPGNAGAAARGAANFGVGDLRFVAPRCDVRSKEALDRARHAKPLLEEARVVDNLDEALAGTSLSVGTTSRMAVAENRYLRRPLDVRDWAEGLQDWTGIAALVFGPEDTGLRGDDVNRLDQLVTVPTAGYASLNLAHAVTLLCYEHLRMRQTARVNPDRHLAPDTLAALNKAFDDLAACTEPRQWRREVAGGVWRKLIGRSAPDDHEVHNVMGILANALKRFEHPDWGTKQSRQVVRERGLRATRVDEEE